MTQSEAEDHAYLPVVPVRPLHFLSDGLTGSTAMTTPNENYDSEQLDQAATQEDRHGFHDSLNPQEAYFEEYLNRRERVEDMFDTPRIPTWQPRRNLDSDHDIVFQHSHGEKFILHQDQHDLAGNFSAHLAYPPERLAEISSI